MKICYRLGCVFHLPPSPKQPCRSRKLCPYSRARQESPPSWCHGHFHCRGKGRGDISIHPNSQCSSVYPPTFYVRLGMQEFPALNGRTGLSEAMERHCQTTKVGESSSRACRDAEPFLPLHSECRVCWGLCGTTAPPSGFSFAQSFARWPNCIPEFWGSQACFPLPRDAQGCCTQLHPCQ